MSDKLDRIIAMLEQADALRVNGMATTDYALRSPDEPEEGCTRLEISMYGPPCASQRKYFIGDEQLKESRETKSSLRLGYFGQTVELCPLYLKHNCP